MPEELLPILNIFKLIIIGIKNKFTPQELATRGMMAKTSKSIELSMTEFMSHIPIAT